MGELNFKHHVGLIGSRFRSYSSEDGGNLTEFLHIIAILRLKVLGEIADLAYQDGKLAI